jgi:putative membrane protein
MAKAWSIRTISHRKYLAILGAIFGVFWVALAIRPWYRQDWLLENVPVILFVTVIAIFHRRWIFSRLSYTLIFIFLCFHIVGAHYTYARTPYDAWFEAIFGRTLNSMLGWERNNYDRVVHFLYGFLLAYPVREIFLRVARVKGFWGYFLPLDLTLSTSALFELVEWGVAVSVADGLGAAYLGTQGDIWDAHKDMALASLGACIAMTITLLVNYRLKRDFAREWAQSLRIKRRPLGEDEIARLLSARE